MNLTSIYRIVLAMARRDGWRVKECNLSKDRLGDIDVKLKLIRIDKNLSISAKITTLAHEYFGHGDQHKEIDELKHGSIMGVSRKARAKKYKSYLIDYLDDNLHYTPARLNTIQFCEIDASRRAKKWLIELFPETEELFNSGDFYLEELGSPKELREMRKQWRKDEFVD